MLTIYNADTKNNGVYHLRAFCSGVHFYSYIDESIRTIYDVYDWVEIERFDKYTKKFGRFHFGRDI